MPLRGSNAHASTRSRHTSGMVCTRMTLSPGEPGEAQPSSLSSARRSVRAAARAAAVGAASGHHLRHRRAARGQPGKSAAASAAAAGMRHLPPLWPQTPRFADTARADASSPAAVAASRPARGHSAPRCAISPRCGRLAPRAGTQRAQMRHLPPLWPPRAPRGDTARPDAPSPPAAAAIHPRRGHSAPRCAISRRCDLPLTSARCRRIAAYRAKRFRTGRRARKRGRGRLRGSKIRQGPQGFSRTIECGQPLPLGDTTSVVRRST